MDQFLNETTYCITTFGCQMNKHDSERLSGMLEGLGSVEVATHEEADIVIFMTCCVREAADVRLIGQAASIRNLPLRESAPYAKRLIAIGGCIGQRDGQALFEQLPHIDIVFGTHNIGSFPRLLQDAIKGEGPCVEVLEKRDGLPADMPIVRKRSWAAWLPITIGCNNFCSYCVVPHVRGREVSRPFDAIVDEARSYVAEGVKEITLLGQNVNSYGRDLFGEPRFAAVLEAVDKTGIDRLRFATSHPKDLTEEVIALFDRLPSLMPAIHLPVQAGSDRILSLMNRRYTRDHYLTLIEALRKACPDIALSTDIIVGFPGETEQDFEETYDLVKKVGYAQVFTFIYSPRQGTPAAALCDDTPREIIQERFDRLVALVQEKAYEQNEKERDKVVEVLVEGPSKRDENILVGKSRKNQTVHATIPETVALDDLVGSFVNVHISKTKTWYLFGEIVD